MSDKNILDHLTEHNYIVFSDPSGTGTMIRHETIGFQLAKKAHCLTKIWDLWIKDQKLSSTQRMYVAKAWRYGTIDLVVDRDELLEILGLS